MNQPLKQGVHLTCAGCELEQRIYLANFSEEEASVFMKLLGLSETCGNCGGVYSSQLFGFATHLPQPAGPVVTD